MKLIPLIVIMIMADIKAQTFRPERFPFPPQFQSPNAGMFSSDSSLYLPPESHTPIPYFPINKISSLQYPLLPPTGTKAPAIYPPHFPLMVSTTLVPNFDDDDDEESHGRIRLSSTPPTISQRFNQTENIDEVLKEKREMRPVPRHYFQQPIQNRNDIKFPFKPQAPPSPSVTIPASTKNQQPDNHQQAPNSTPAGRRMIISSENQKNDMGFEQARSASFQAPQFLPAGGGLYVSSTEPAIPILRLSNEMDLDGSFSYEALGADQTHYVQHSRMENMGPDKVEQVVEGSYSYVGDNGQTYTVHYIADANGFRASGDHLPVAPAVPEIIQRAVQYNLAEEAKKPPHLRDNGSWQDNGNWQNNLKDNEISDNTKHQQFSLPPTRNLFTGRTPEAFSYSYSQGSNTGNNLVAAASTQTPIKTVEYTTEQSKPKPNNGPISPQITFLASQGAHVPAINTVQDTISRMFTTEKMPQLVNYEAVSKEAEQDPNKGLWRWQYGYNANNLLQNSNKDTISRSSGEGDDIMINFGEMTPEQYTQMIHSQFEYTPNSNMNNKNLQNVQINKPLTQNHINSYPTLRTNEQKQYQSSVQSEENKPKQSQYLATDLGQNEKINNEAYENYIRNQQAPQPQYEDISNAEYSTRNENLQQAHYQDSSNFSNKDEPIKHSLQTVTPSFQPDSWHKRNQNENSVGPSTASSNIESRKLISGSSKILTHKDFVYPSKTITQSYNFDEESFYEPRKIKALSTESTNIAKTNSANNNHDVFNRITDVTEGYMPPTNSLNNMYNVPQRTNDVTEINETVTKSDNSMYNVFQNTNEGTWVKIENEIKESTTPESLISSVSNFKFTDFIFQEDKSSFKPITTTTSTETQRFPETTTENIIEDILENNIFLKNLFNVEKTEAISPKKMEVKSANKYFEEPPKLLNIKIETEAEPKAEKNPKFVQYHAKPINEVKIFRKKPMDIAEIINYVSMKNHFESNKMKPKSTPPGDSDHRSDVRFIPIQHEREENENVSKQNPVIRPHIEHQAELRGLIKNYKVLQRNNNVNKYDNVPLKRELSPPPLKSPNLPPLGRAGPSMKSYLPPIFV